MLMEQWIPRQVHDDALAMAAQQYLELKSELDSAQSAHKRCEQELVRLSEFMLTQVSPTTPAPPILTQCVVDCGYSFANKEYRYIQIHTNLEAHFHDNGNSGAQAAVQAPSGHP